MTHKAIFRQDYWIMRIISDLLLLISPSPESENHTQSRADLGEQVNAPALRIT
jgi:hypothetical protein